MPARSAVGKSKATVASSPGASAPITVSSTIRPSAGSPSKSRVRCGRAPARPTLRTVAVTWTVSPSSAEGGSRTRPAWGTVRFGAEAPAQGVQHQRRLVARCRPSFRRRAALRGATRSRLRRPPAEPPDSSDLRGPGRSRKPCSGSRRSRRRGCAAASSDAQRRGRGAPALRGTVGQSWRARSTWAVTSVETSRPATAAQPPAGWRRRRSAAKARSHRGRRRDGQGAASARERERGVERIALVPGAEAEAAVRGSGRAGSPRTARRDRSAAERTEARAERVEPGSPRSGTAAAPSQARPRVQRGPGWPADATQRLQGRGGVAHARSRPRPPSVRRSDCWASSQASALSRSGAGGRVAQAAPRPGSCPRTATPRVSAKKWPAKRRADPVDGREVLGASGSVAGRGQEDEAEAEVLRRRQVVRSCARPRRRSPARRVTVSGRRGDGRALDGQLRRDRPPGCAAA